MKNPGQLPENICISYRTVIQTGLNFTISVTQIQQVWESWPYSLSQQDASLAECQCHYLRVHELEQTNCHKSSLVGFPSSAKRLPFREMCTGQHKNIPKLRALERHWSSVSPDFSHFSHLMFYLIEHCKTYVWFDSFLFLASEKPSKIISHSE